MAADDTRNAIPAHGGQEVADTRDAADCCETGRGSGSATDCCSEGEVDCCGSATDCCAV